MSESSPFRTENNNEYRWPPATVTEVPERLYRRVTTFLSLGEPQQDWVRPHLRKQYSEHFVNEGPKAFQYLLDSWSLKPEQFPPNQDWWNRTLDLALSLDILQNEKRQRWDALKKNGEELFQKTRPKVGGRVAKYLALTPPQKYLKYFKEIPETYRDVAARRGTEVHRIAEAIGRGFDVVYDEALEKHVYYTRQFFKDFRPEFIEIESVVYSDKFGYAGQFDFLAKIPTEVLKTMVVDESTGELWVDTRDKTAPHYDPDYVTVFGDYKTSAKGIRASVALQEAMYVNADFIGREDGTKDPIPHIDEHWAVNLRDDGYFVVPVRVDDVVWSKAKAVMEVADWMEQVKPTVLKPALKPREEAA